MLLSARRVGPSGKAYGLDMTDEMLALARENQRKAGVENVEFLKGEIENIPLPDNSVDVIISNCVINLSGDKDRVLREAFRVLKPGGRFAVSDVVTRGEVPPDVRQNMLLWVGCIAGALQDYDYVAKLAKAGFDGIDIEPTRVYDIEDARTFLSGPGRRCGRDCSTGRRQIHERLYPRNETRLLLRSWLLFMTWARRIAAEAVGTAFLLAAVVGSGIMGERLAGGNVAIALLANTLATGAMLVTLILTFGPISGAHFNPAVTLADASQGGLPWREVPGYLAAQLIGAFAGVAAAHLMFGEAVFSASRHVRAGGAQLFSEFVATFGLLCVIWGCARLRSSAVPFAVGAYITGAYWFTASTSFANPAVTLARSASDTFAGIRPADAPGFIAAQLAGAVAATVLFRWLVPSLPKDAAAVVVSHPVE